MLTRMQQAITQDSSFKSMGFGVKAACHLRSITSEHVMLVTFFMVLRHH